MIGHRTWSCDIHDAIGPSPVKYGGGMGRWEPNPRDRLMRSALVLFGERGYDNTTVADIAQHAGLTKSSFFRLFTDKREVLFSRQEELEHLLVTAVAEAPANASAMELILTALTSLESFYVNDRRDFAIALQKVLANNTELQERELLKRVYLARSMARAMRERGVDDATAGLAAEIAVMILYDAFAAWSEPQNDKRFETLAKTSLRRILDSARHLGMEIGGKHSAV